MSSDSPPPVGPNEFETEAARGSASLVREFLGFLAHNKKWWLLPILLLLLGLSVLVLLGGTAIAPFIYTLF